jgi:heme-degrading monooxygenase HmoA
VHSRVIPLEIDTMRVDVDEAVERFRAEVLPALREQDGYEGVIVLVNPEGPGAIVSLWRDEGTMQAAAGFASAALERFATIFRNPPGREHYAVRVLDLPTVPNALEP